MTRQPHVIVIGAGFSGLLTAIHMLRGAATVRVSLIERRSAFGPGTAYDTGNADHLLNVRLGNMSAFPDTPTHLADWLGQQAHWEASGEFITRGVYGAYLRDLLDEAVADNPGRLALVSGQAVSLDRLDATWSVTLDGGESLIGDAVVLAIGNQEPSTPAGIDEDLRRSSLYVENPWSGGALVPDQARQVLLIGTGLTAVDIALALERPGRTITALSRHGLLPRAHATVSTPAVAMTFSGSVSQIMQQARAASRTQDWREVFDALRHQAIAIWRGWDMAERQRFIRHVRPVWDVHRHRLAPVIARRIASLIADGSLCITPGKIVQIKRDGDAIQAVYRPRGRRRSVIRRFDAVVNCTGPLGRVADSADPLIQDVLHKGFAAPDPMGLGFQVDEDGDLIHPTSTASNLHVIGPLARATFWEMTSVPDLRGQAQKLAERILVEVRDA
ncbi:pyridine nucleotide-disulfide oxidoreductase [Brevundimonas intermedia]|uniref:Pyridine nucleotide-disulfide oxidoreductase n=1 Tax=Brevundimonas intermedia TaxID=74315 RepID=A0ABQ5T5R7_9CAUL|nr:FAD/NAD(P)-binding protein [Brevundimonas intermedia]GLK47663.1 pyridine nucleotide-disulfide oxidoreductase [Brevundimonas intermedia]